MRPTPLPFSCRWLHSKKLLLCCASREQVRGNGHQIPPLSDRHAEKTSALFHGPFAGKLPDSNHGNPSRCGNMRGAKEFPGVTPMVGGNDSPKSALRSDVCYLD